MALLDRLRQELDRAGQTAQRAFDEGRIRLDLFRARQSVDRFAQRFGYAVYHAKKAGGELAPEELAAHLSNLTAAEAEVGRLETLLAESAKQRRSGPPPTQIRDHDKAAPPPPQPPPPPPPRPTSASSLRRSRTSSPHTPSTPNSISEFAARREFTVHAITRPPAS